MNTNIWNHDEAKEMIEEKKRLVKEGHETKPISDEEAEMLFKKRPN